MSTPGSWYHADSQSWYHAVSQGPARLSVLVLFALVVMAAIALGIWKARQQKS